MKDSLFWLSVLCAPTHMHWVGQKVKRREETYLKWK